ncbi:MAG TPA: aminotransferase class V-fold PLP-dependent enzyme [Gemmataceae bacterium]|nr:aminotransferase class V-fold PLP-dependent enzyme [Gemmataceae bacterium]
MASRPMIPLYKVHMPAAAAGAVAEVLASGQLAAGEVVRRFETALGEYLSNLNLITCADEASALVLALYLAGVRPGDEVLASPMACLAVNMPVLNLFARVVWCDIDPRTGNLAASEIDRRATPRTKAVLYAHWAGDVADIDAINAAARRRGLKVVEDAGEALGAEYGGRRVGATGSDYVVFSFYAIRHLTTGEGAAITFADPAECERARWLKRFGIHVPTFRDSMGEINPASDIPIAGFNTYLTNIAAAIGLSQMPHLEEVVRRHRENGLAYDRALQDVPGVGRLKRLPQARSAYWVYTLLADRPDDLLRALRDRGVYASRVHLRNDGYSCFGTGPVDYPGLEAFSSRYLCIPCGWWVGPEDREYIVDCIRRGW